MSINCEQFIDGSYRDIGYRFSTSNNLRQLLSPKSLRFLRDLTPNPKIVRTLLPEGYVAVSYIQNGQDESGRTTMYNRTTILTVQDYFKLHETYDRILFEPYLAKMLDKPPTRLEPLHIP